MDLSLKEHLTGEFENVGYAETYNYVKGLNRDIVNLALTDLLREKQRLKRESPQQIVGMVEEKKKQLLQKVKKP